MSRKVQSRILFLEDELRSAASTSDSAQSLGAASTSVSARSILTAWAELRNPFLLSSDPYRVAAALRTLHAARSFLHVADPQAKVLLSLLSSVSSLPPGSLSLILGLLYCWLRKSHRASSNILNSVVAALSHLLSSPPQSPALAVLLLGAFAASPVLEESSRRECLDLLCHILASEAFEEELVPEVLAGIGYALSRSDDVYFGRILSSLLQIWNRGVIRPSLYYGLMILALVDWLVSGFVNSRYLCRIDSLCGEISVENWKVKGYAPFAVFMSAAGVLRALRMVSASKVKFSPQTRNLVEGSISSVAEVAVSILGVSLEKSLLLQCISVGLARCGLVSFSAPMLLALCEALLKEIFPLGRLCAMALKNSRANSTDSVIDKVKGHFESIIFKEAGAITSVFCNQYAYADEKQKTIIEKYIWEYTLEFYSNIRDAALVLRRQNDQLMSYIEKVAEAAFLMVVVFAAEVSRQRLNSKSSPWIQPEVAVKILIAFSCIEYMRRIRLPEYTEAIRCAILTMQEHVALCVSFVESMPTYVELTNKQGMLNLAEQRYAWSEDLVRSSRLLFFLRVLPTCISLIPALVFGKLIVPMMFLCLHHPNEKVARASHSVFVAFMSSGKDSDNNERLDLKEKLVFYYTQRALEAYPCITPFEGLASGVVSLVRHLPAGSPAIFYCINYLAKKAADLCKEATSEDVAMWKNWEGNSEPSKKVIDLLMRLIYLVDIQVLPYLLKQLAEFILRLAQEGKKVMLDQLYVQVAESDDVIRKPVLVSWLQSLSYLCSGELTSSYSPMKHLGSTVCNGVSMNNTSGEIMQSML
ncbi:hypothetical protein HPP92_020926 [Vanilla planifolia]|uniref:Uncharacterized protein n=1 Tax=Vanilla planifolia TaxID=51239 RepID=A0A835Q1D7_VANPL|nr:hypothetical protein HPP92_020926 [Vanilla planifolia]